MVEHEHGRAVRPQVLLAGDLQRHAAADQRDVAARAGADVPAEVVYRDRLRRLDIGPGELSRSALAALDMRFREAPLDKLVNVTFEALAGRMEDELDELGERLLCAGPEPARNRGEAARAGRSASPARARRRRAPARGSAAADGPPP